MPWLKSKIENASEDIRNNVVLWNSQGRYANEIQELLKVDHDFEISTASIRKFIKKHTDVVRNITVGSPAYQSRVIKEFGSIILRLKKASDILERRMEMLEEEDGKTSEMCMVAERLERECELASKLVGNDVSKNESTKDTVLRVTEELYGDGNPPSKETTIVKREVKKK